MVIFPDVFLLEDNGGINVSNGLSRCRTGKEHIMTNGKIGQSSLIIRGGIKMRISALAVTAMLAIVFMACPVLAQMSSQPSMTMSNAVTITATVVAIDRADREVTLRDPQGNTITVDVDPSVKNFNQIMVGDKVNVDYYEAIAISIGPQNQMPSESMTTITGRGPAGTKPEGYAIETVDTVSIVKAIDRTNRIVTLQSPTGNLFNVKVPQTVQAFNQLKVGDSVQTRYTEATAISVQKS